MSDFDDQRMIDLGGEFGRLKIRLQDWGNIRALTNASKKAFTDAVWMTLSGYGAEMKEAAREDVRKSGMRKANRLAGAVRTKMFPARPNGALRPAFVIGTNAPHIFEAHEKGGTIEFENGAGLVPIGVARQMMAGFPIGKPHTDILDAVKARFGTQFTSRRSKKTGKLQLGVFSALQSGKLRFVPLFNIVASVNLPKRLHFQAIVARYQAGLPARLAQRVPQLWAERVRAAGGEVETKPRVTIAA